MEIQPSVPLTALNFMSLDASKIFTGAFVAIIILIILSAFFSMSETVFSSISEAKLKTFVEDRRNGSKKALACTENFDRTLTTLLVGNNIVNTALSVLSVGYFTTLGIGKNYVELVSTLIITVILLIFGEITPKTLGKKYNDKIVLVIAPIIHALTFILYPIVQFFRGFQLLVSGKNKDNAQVNEDELETILDTMEEEGSIEADEVTLIKKVFDLNDRTVEDIMIPRIDMIAINADASIDDVRNLCIEQNFSRIPVYEEDKDHIIGILYERDFFHALASNLDFKSPRDIMKPVKFVNKAMTVDALIKELQISKMHMVIVSGEYGDTLGLVTMEDALEEIVGEIYDEHDEGSISEKLIEKLEDNEYLIDADMYVSDMFDELGLGEAPEGTAKVSTWVFESLEDLPGLGSQIKHFASYTLENEDGQYEDYEKILTLEVVDIKDRRIEKVKATITDATPEEISKHNEEE